MVSNHGGILQPEKRIVMSPLLHILLIFYFIEFGAVCFGTYLIADWQSQYKSECASSNSVVHSLLTFTVISVWLDLSLFGLVSYLVTNRNKNDKYGAMSTFEAEAIRWDARCHSWCSYFYCMTCGCFGNRANQGKDSDFAFNQVGQVFATFFGGFKLTPTEWLAGILMIKAAHKENRAQAVREIVIDSQPQHSPSPGQRLEVKSERLGSHRNMGADIASELQVYHDILPYTEAINTWKLMLLQAWIAGNPIASASKLVRDSLKHSYHRITRGNHAGDNCCSWNHTAFVHVSGISSDDIVFSSFTSYAAELVAFAVAVDHQKKNVVVAFRGSLALADFLTDGALQPTSLEDAGKEWGFDGRGHYAHGAMLKVALKIRGILEESEILAKLFNKPVVKKYYSQQISDLERSSMASSSRQLPNCTGYKLLVLGESLGAGIASIETLLLRSAFPQVHGYGISTPGCMFSRELAEECSSYFTTVFAGKDLVPRANWQSLQKIRLESLQNLRRCKVNKNVCLRSAYKNTRFDDMAYAEDQVPDNKHTRRLQKMMDHAVCQITDHVHTELYKIPMFCPGKLIHMIKTQTVVENGWFRNKRKRAYEAVLIHDRSDLCHFELSRRMIEDHMPTVVREAIEYAIESNLYTVPLVTGPFLL